MVRKKQFIPDMIHEIKKMSQSYVIDIFKDEDVHSAHIFYILCLKKHGKMTQMQLSKETKNDKAHTTRIISGLVDKNFIESDSPDKTRNQMWQLTKTGEEIACRLEKELEKWFKIITKNISKEDLMTTHHTIITMLENAKNLKKEKEKI